MIASKTLLFATTMTLAATAIVACSSGPQSDSDPVPASTSAAALASCNPDAGAFTLSAAPLSKSAPVVNGQATLSYTITATQVCGTPDTATLSAVGPGLPAGSVVTFDPPSMSTNGGATTATFVLPPTADTAEWFAIRGWVATGFAQDMGWTQSHYPTMCSKPPCICRVGYHMCNGVCVPQAQACLDDQPWIDVWFDQ